MSEKLSIKDSITFVEETIANLNLDNTSDQDIKDYHKCSKALRLPFISENTPDSYLAVFGGRPGMGTTTYCLHIIIENSLKGLNKNPKNCLAYFLADEKKEIVKRLFNIISANNLDDLQRAFLKKEKPIGNEKKSIVNRSKHAINELHNLNLSVGGILSKNIEQAKDTIIAEALASKAQYIIIDGIGMLTGYSNTDDFNPYHHLPVVSNNGQYIKMLHELKTYLRIPIVYTAKLGHMLELRGGDKRPYMSDFENHAIENYSDIVHILHRPGYFGFMEDEFGNDISDLLEISCLKSKFFPTGIYQARFDAKIPCFVEEIPNYIVEGS
ncbi:MAG: hypothetical protein COC01_03535 [Bacteroidetes bacterium]|nr:hypothetical protein [Bacteroidia bacterium]MBN4052350.1 hypothetical protein [Sphingobacteriaceae bacterium AH-315-L07]PCH68575.1 MAG: hypothetical protein COC01_03535 [Bacteroidota bacterium]